MADHQKAMAHARQIMQHAKAGNTKMAQQHAFHAAKALAREVEPDEPDTDEDDPMADKWIQGAIQHPGAEKTAAKKAGMSTHEFMEKHKASPGKAGARARLGLRLSAMNKKKG